LETFRRPIADARAKFGYARVSTREHNPDHQVDALLWAPGYLRSRSTSANGKLASRPKLDALLANC
jgi:DNA invertase Pin-like site-specific DNA recombinase